MLHTVNFPNLIETAHYTLDIKLDFYSNIPPLENTRELSKKDEELYENTLLDSIVNHNFSVEQLMYNKTYISVLAKEFQANHKEISLYGVTVKLTKCATDNTIISKFNQYKL